MTAPSAARWRAPGRDDIVAAYPRLGEDPFWVELNDVYARAASDAWAVGHIHLDIDRGYEQTPALHWNGSHWRVVPTPKPPTDSGDTVDTHDVVALGPDDVWAVGGFARGSDDVGPVTAQPFAMHWDGSSWTLAPGTELGDEWGAAAWRRPGAEVADLVVGRLPHNGPEGFSPMNGPLIERYKSGSLPLTAPGASMLWGVAAIAWNNVWAVGDPAADGSAVTLHRDGVRWSVVPTPSAAPSQWHSLAAVSAVSTDDVWAVGTARTTGGASQPLIEHRTEPAGRPGRHRPPRRHERRSMRPSGNGWAVGYTGTRRHRAQRHPAALLGPSRAT